MSRAISKPEFYHSYKFYSRQISHGRPDLAAANAAVAGRMKLAYRLFRRYGLAPRSAWRAASHWHRTEN